jgi:hypothetical protein
MLLVTMHMILNAGDRFGKTDLVISECIMCFDAYHVNQWLCLAMALGE